jgi:O-antigen ligase/tetratricopeptide (TPR) repeat protein
MMTNLTPRQTIIRLASSAAALFCVSALLVSSSSYLFIGLPAFMFGLYSGIIFIGGYLIVRGFLRGAGLPKSGLELPLIAFVAALLGSLAFSANPRVGLERVAQWLVLIVLFYIALDGFDSNAFRTRTRWAFLWVSGFLTFFALSETYAWYLSWWSDVGSRSLMPPFQYRFVSLAMHSSFFMMIVNMCAPLAVVTLFRAKRWSARFGSIFWLVIYLIATPFSTSRAGWLGAAAWIFTLIVLCLQDKESRSIIFNRVRQYNLKTLVLGGAVGSAVLLIAILFIYKVFAAPNPAHGGGASLNRELIWGSTFTVIKSSPWWGSGPGQLTQNLLPASKQSPFEFWPVNAHSTPLQILAEFGLVGFIPFCMMVVLGIYRGVKIFRVTRDSERVWLWASAAGLAAIVVQGFFDDVTNTLFPMVLVLFHVVSILHQANDQLRFPRISMAWLAIPSLIAAFITGSNVWAIMPYDQAADLAKEKDWVGAAQAIDKAVQRDPTQPGYWNQAGLVWASVWRESGDSQALATACDRFERALILDSGNSLIWANLAILDWHSGLHDRALSNIEKAISLSPDEPSYWLNRAFFLEQLGFQEEAVDQYRLVIMERPETVSHPFWVSSPVREKALEKARRELSDDQETPYWQAARAALESNDFSDARVNLAMSSLYKETSTATVAGWAELAKREGNTEEARNQLEFLVDSVEDNYWGLNIYIFRFGFRRFSFGVVPGFLKIDDDSEKFAALHELVQIQVQEGDCQAAARTWKVLQRELRAGEWLDDGYPPAPACP